MSDITYNYNATVRRDNTDVVTGNGSAYKAIVHTSTIELPVVGPGATIKIGRFPSSARISMQSILLWDDLASSGAPTIDIGVAPVNGNITADADALNDGLDAASAGSATRIVKDFANVGKQLWEYVNGQTSNPGGMLDIYLSVVDAATNIVGTISAEILYVVD